MMIKVYSLRWQLPGNVQTAVAGRQWTHPDYRMILVVTNTEAITLKIDPSVFWQPANMWMIKYQSTSSHDAPGRLADRKRLCST